MKKLTDEERFFVVVEAILSELSNLATIISSSCELVGLGVYAAKERALILNLIKIVNDRSVLLAGKK